MPTSRLPIEWDESLATGLGEIDEQHRWLFKLVNDAYALWNRDNTLSQDALIEIVKGLQDYVAYHFETEERLMVKYAFFKDDTSGASSHCTQHHHFSSKIAAIAQTLGDGDTINQAEFLGYLSDWLIHHVKNTDQKLGAFIAAKRQDEKGN